MTTKGHLFVIHGRIESVVHDAAIIPVDRSLHFEDHWRNLLPSWPDAPTGWNQRGWGRVDEQVAASAWLVEVGLDDYENVVARVKDALADIAKTLKAEGHTTLGRRTLPLIALPVIGIGAGGHSHERGRTIKDLVSTLSAVALDQSIDIALVTPDRSVYAAAQFVRRGEVSSLPKPLEEEARRLGDLSERGELSLFLGAGVSIPAGLMSWDELIEKLLETVATHQAGTVVTPADLKNLNATDQAELIQRQDKDGFQGHVVTHTATAEQPSLLHALAVGLDVHEVVTTNYDLLYEQAAKAAGRDVKAVMPWTSAGDADRWILKLHGDITHREAIVLTRRHMVRYDAENRPSAAMLQSLMLTRHLLFLGTSFTDDNVIRLAHEVQAYRERHLGHMNSDESAASPSDHAFGTVVDAGNSGSRRRLWEDELRWFHHKSKGISSTRAVELLLDRVGVHASQDASWLLDPRFAGLLSSDQDREIASDARGLLHHLPRDEKSVWWPLREALLKLGADPRAKRPTHGSSQDHRPRELER